MLQSFLVNLRKQRSIGAAQAVTRLAQGWEADNGSLQKEFTFSDFREASNFVQRYSLYCQKAGLAPQWSNVYNRVNVTLTNSEFGEVGTKEVEIANYLDMVSRVKIHSWPNIDEHRSFEQIAAAGGIEVQSAVNHQEIKTDLFLDNSEHHYTLA